MFSSAGFGSGVVKVKRFVSYLQAVRNEIAIDEYVVSLFPDNFGLMICVPRASRWMSCVRYSRYLFFITYKILVLLWVSGGAIFFYFCQALPFIFNFRSKSGGSEFIRLVDIEYSIVLALSSRVGDVVDYKFLNNLPSLWITVPWAPLRRVPESVVCIDVFSLLSRLELLQALRDAIIATYMLLWRKRTSRWVLQSYTAFRWFAVRRAVDKLPGTLIMTEHFDRWAVLVDSSVAASNRAARMGGNNCSRKLVLIQHGALGGLGVEEGFLKSTLCLPTKLRCVSQLYVYNPEEENAFKTDVLSHSCSQRVEVYYFKPGIELDRSVTDTRLRVLFVGHPLCEQLHEYLFRRLRENFELTAYYKPHPMAPMSMMMGQVGWAVISDKINFPEVDLLVSYPSTLVIEYEGAGVPAMVHPMNMLPSSAEDYLALLLKALASIKSERNIV